MDTLYGHFDPGEMEEFKEAIHKDIHWLLLYKDPEMGDKFRDVNYDLYFDTFMRNLDGFDALACHPKHMVELMSVLQAAYIEAKKEPFHWWIYRRLVLNAHKIVDKLCVRETDAQ